MVRKERWKKSIAKLLTLLVIKFTFFNSKNRAEKFQRLFVTLNYAVLLIKNKKQLMSSEKNAFLMINSWTMS